MTVNSSAKSVILILFAFSDNLSAEISNCLRNSMTAKAAFQDVCENVEADDEQEIPTRNMGIVIQKSKSRSQDGLITSYSSAPTWIIDPIDGTMNFVHSNPLVCTSVGLTINRKLVAGHYRHHHHHDHNHQALAGLQPAGLVGSSFEYNYTRLASRLRRSARSGLLTLGKDKTPSLL